MHNQQAMILKLYLLFEGDCSKSFKIFNIEKLNYQSRGCLCIFTTNIIWLTGNQANKNVQEQYFFHKKAKFFFPKVQHFPHDVSVETYLLLEFL